MTQEDIRIANIIWYLCMMSGLILFALSWPEMQEHAKDVWRRVCEDEDEEEEERRKVA